MKIIAVIPARSGSKGLSDKNIKPLAGRPLMAYSIAAAKLVALIDRVIVSTDSEKYADIAKSYGAEAPFLRPTELAGDKSTDYDFVKHLLDWLQTNEGEVPEYLVHLRPTTPLRDPKLIDTAIELFINNPNATSLRSAHEMPESAYKTFEVENNYFKTVGSGSFELDTANNPRQEFLKTYAANGYADVLKTSFILKTRMIHGNRVLAFITSRVVEVDTIEEFELLECMIHKNNYLFKRLFF